MHAYPLLFEPILKEKVWGGRRLEAFGKTLPGDALIGESWELADLPLSIEGGRSVVANGSLAGRQLRDVIESHQKLIMGTAPLSTDGGFPLLIKFLDARENLSVQVHPSPEYAARHPEAHLKSEAWYVLAADPGAVIYKGVEPDVTAAQFREHILSGTVAEDLIAVPVAPGDCHYLPSGTCHALGAGILVAEIQTPSDTTFRVFDWGRSGRTLHVEQALQCISFGRPLDESPVPSTPIHTTGMVTKHLTSTDFFTIERIDVTSDSSLPIETSGQPMVWMHLAGSGAISSAHAATVELRTGTTCLLPAGLIGSVAQLGAGSSMLQVKLPPPTKGMLA